MEERSIRDQIVVATKVNSVVVRLQTLMLILQQYTVSYKRGAPPSFGQKAHYIGNNLKSMSLSVEASLKKLCTHYIDILYVHW